MGQALLVTRAWFLLLNNYVYFNLNEVIMCDKLLNVNTLINLTHLAQLQKLLNNKMIYIYTDS